MRAGRLRAPDPVAREARAVPRQAVPEVRVPGVHRGGAVNAAALRGNPLFVPYVYGAASGRPSRGRPEKVLANPERPPAVIERLAAAPETAPDARGRTPAAGHGTPAAERRHYRLGEKPCEACRAARSARAAARWAQRKARSEGEAAEDGGRAA